MMNALLRFFFAMVIAFSFLAPTISEAKNTPQGKYQKAKKPKAAHKQKFKKGKAHRVKRPHVVRPKIFVPNRGLSDKQNKAIRAHNICVSGGDNALRHAMDLAYEAKDDTSLKGTPEKLGRETCLAKVLGLSHYFSDRHIDDAVAVQELVVITSPLLAYPADVPLGRRVARPWVNDYIVLLAKDMERFVNEERVEHSDPLLRIPSTTRSFDGQDRLVRMGKSPANCFYLPICSTHTTGSAIDISVRFLSPAQFTWLEARLREDRRSGKILIIYEQRGGHFHMFVIPPVYVAWYKEDAPNIPTPMLASPIRAKPPS
jgi:hypothetical protein